MILNGKTVIVTGGSAGVGAAAARMFAEAGANLMLVARDKKNLEAIAEELREKTRVEIFAMDVADPDACVDLFKKSAIRIWTRGRAGQQRGISQARQCRGCQRRRSWQNN